MLDVQLNGIIKIRQQEALFSTMLSDLTQPSIEAKIAPFFAMKTRFYGVLKVLMNLSKQAVSLTG